MNALNNVLGLPGDPVACRTIGEVSVHWWNGVANVGDWCLCGETQKKADNRHHRGDGDHCDCWLNEEKACCACGYDGDEAIDCTGTMKR